MNLRGVTDRHVDAEVKQDVLDVVRGGEGVFPWTVVARLGEDWTLDGEYTVAVRHLVLRNYITPDADGRLYVVETTVSEAEEVQ